MFGGLEWLFWFMIAGIFITIIYLIVMHFVLKNVQERSSELDINLLEDKVIDENRVVVREVGEKISW